MDYKQIFRERRVAKKFEALKPIEIETNKDFEETMGVLTIIGAVLMAILRFLGYTVLAVAVIAAIVAFFVWNPVIAFSSLAVAYFIR